jgi:hypothetical protein
MIVVVTRAGHHRLCHRAWEGEAWTSRSLVSLVDARRLPGCAGLDIWGRKRESLPVSKRDASREVVQRAAAVAGAAATGGPAGAGVALAVNSLQAALERTKEQRFAGAPLGELQRERVEDAYQEAKRVIDAQVMAHGRTPRSDWFEHPPGDHVPAAETLELTLIAAAESYERRKVKVLANIMGLLAFEPRVTHAAGLYLIRIVRELSYRQLVVLAAVVEMSEGPPTRQSAELDFVLSPTDPLPKVEAAADANANEHIVSASLSAELLDMTYRDLLRQGDRAAASSNRWQLRARSLYPSVAGRRLYVLCALGTHVRSEERREVAEQLLRMRTGEQCPPAPQSWTTRQAVP